MLPILDETILWYNVCNVLNNWCKRTAVFQWFMSDLSSCLLTKELLFGCRIEVRVVKRGVLDKGSQAWDLESQPQDLGSQPWDHYGTDHKL